MQRWEALKQIVPRDDELKCKLRMHFLVAYCHVLDGSDHRLKLFFGRFELLVRPYDLVEGCDLRLWLSGLVESIEQFVSVRYSLAADLNWIGLFRRHGKNAACL